MHILAQRGRLMFFGTVRELRAYLRTLPTDLTLREFIHQQIH